MIQVGNFVNLTGGTLQTILGRSPFVYPQDTQQEKSGPQSTLVWLRAPLRFGCQCRRQTKRKLLKSSTCNIEEEILRASLHLTQPNPQDTQQEKSGPQSTLVWLRAPLRFGCQCRRQTKRKLLKSSTCNIEEEILRASLYLTQPNSSNSNKTKLKDVDQSGAPNDAFPLNALKHCLSYPEYFQIFRNTLQSAPKNLYLFGHPRAISFFPKLPGLLNSIISPKILGFHFLQKIA